MTFSDFFLYFSDNRKVLTSAPHIAVLWHCVHATYPCRDSWSNTGPTIGRLAKLTSQGYWEVQKSHFFSFRCLAFIFGLTCHYKDRSTAVGMVGAMQPAILPALARAWCHVVQLIANVHKNSNTRPLYPDTMPFNWTHPCFVPILELYPHPGTYWN